ncbi:hypothetical protein [Pigmentiphaga humi]|uniref:hypothetical protein n=1 Tax=Pigmentiphaga humi TaxID=2478468 RepID=UPI00135C9A04|nr:hypothetical protein [Pigmentiphaga humi]
MNPRASWAWRAITSAMLISGRVEAGTLPLGIRDRAKHPVRKTDEARTHFGE